MNKSVIKYSAQMLFMVMMHCLLINADNDTTTTTTASGANSIAVGRVGGDVIINTYITQNGTILLGNLFDDALSTAKTLVAKFLYGNVNPTDDQIAKTQSEITLLNNCLYDAFTVVPQQQPGSGVVTDYNAILSSKFAQVLRVELLQKNMPQLQGLHVWYTQSAFVSKNSAAVRLSDLEQKALGVVVIQNDVNNSVKSQPILSVKTILNSLIIGSSYQDTAQGNVQNMLSDTLILYDDCVKASQLISLLCMGLTNTYQSAPVSYFNGFFPKKLYNVFKNIINNGIVVPKAIELGVKEALEKAQTEASAQLKQLTDAELAEIKTKVAADVEQKLKMN